MALRRVSGKVWNDVAETEASIRGFLRVQAHVGRRSGLQIVHRGTHRLLVGNLLDTRDYRCKRIMRKV